MESDKETCDFYRDKWLNYHSLANQKENEELNIKKNSKWCNVEKDAKKLWKMIDWKGKIAEDKTTLSNQEIHSFFKNVFQANKLKDDPILERNSTEITVCNNTVFSTDKDISIVEVNKACDGMGTGFGMDGIPPAVCRFFPPALKQKIMHLFRMVFDGDYPEKWYSQLLTALPKQGHSTLCPKLRGIGVGQLLSRIYDDIIDGRFKSWYVPNPEQAGYCELQGCIVQLFALFMMIFYAKRTGKTLIIGLLDFEKAFDYTNRKILISKLIEDGIGYKLAGAIKEMYLDTKYFPKIGRDRIGDAIESKFGVTQGRKSSANFFTYFLSDMGMGLKNAQTTDFMDPFCLLQLADDTNLLAETIRSIIIKFSKLFSYAIERLQRINTKKTKYMHLSEDPIMEKLTLDSGDIIDPVDPKDG